METRVAIVTRVSIWARNDSRGRSEAASELLSLSLPAWEETWPTEFRQTNGAVMPLILIILLVVLLFGGGGYYYGRGAGWGAPHYGGGLVGLIVIILLVVWLTGNLRV